MNLRSIWAELGIEATKDVGAIRRAYAHRLRETNADQDADAFSNLRSARDEALRLAAMDDASLEHELVADRDNSMSSDIPHEVPQEYQKYDAHYEAIIRLLRLDQENGSNDPAFEPDLKEKFAVHFNAVQSDPRMTEITYYARAEIWFAEALARSTPLSHPLLRSVSQHYRWMEREGELGEAPAIAFIVDRIQTFDFAEALEERKHPWHKAWVELRKPTSSRSRRGWDAKRRDVLALLNNVREQHPHLEGAFDWHRVALWENEQPKYVSVGFIVLILWIILKIAISISNVNSDTGAEQPTSYTDLSNPEADIDQALQQIFSGADVSAQQIRIKNPDLFKNLKTIWSTSHNTRQNREQFIGDVSQFFLISFSYNKQIIPYDLLRDYNSILLEIAKYSRENLKSEECDQAFHYAQSRFLISSELEKRERSTFYKILLTTRFDDNASAPESTFSIPGPVIAMMLNRTGMQENKFREVLEGKGSSKDRCNVHIALVETVLAMPRKEGALLLAKL